MKGSWYYWIYQVLYIISLKKLLSFPSIIVLYSVIFAWNKTDTLVINFKRILLSLAVYWIRYKLHDLAFVVFQIMIPTCFQSYPPTAAADICHVLARLVLNMPCTSLPSWKIFALVSFIWNMLASPPTSSFCLLE